MHTTVKRSVSAIGNMQQIINGLYIICQFVFKIIFILAPLGDNIPYPAIVYNCGKRFFAKLKVCDFFDKNFFISS